jgi:hypothetical protein
MQMCSTFAAGEKRATRYSVKQKKLRRNFLKPVSFEMIFCAALHCGMWRSSGSTAENKMHHCKSH